MNPVRISFRNVRRNRIRAVLTIASVFFSILLLCVLEATLTMWTNTQDDGAAALRLVVRNKNSLAQPLPEAYRQKRSC